MVATLPRSRYLNVDRPVVAVEAAGDGAGRVQTALHRDLGDAGQLVERHHVADGEHLGMAGKRQVGEDGDAAGAVDVGSRRLGEHRGER